jgi:hypothetical protein
VNKEIEYIPTKDQIKEQEAESEVELRRERVQMLEEFQALKTAYNEFRDRLELNNEKIKLAVAQKWENR